MSKKYDSYKDSGIEWIGEIPSHWESWKISHAFNRIGSGTTPESGNPIYHENGTVNWLNTGDLNDGFIDSCSKQITQKALEDYSSLKLFPAGSLVMAMYGATIGKTAILNFETTTNQACCVFCESEIINLRFLQYWFIGNKEQIINLAIGGGQPNISQNILKDIRLWCPDYSEQLSLNNFLDHKTSQIDDLIAKKERLIQLLEEERTAIINQAVTKGLDLTVPMKDSGIEWLGEIPAHWFLVPVKRVIEVRDGTHDTPEYVQNELISYPLITSKDFDGEEINFSNAKMISETDHKAISKRSGVKSGDVLMSMIGGNIGKSLIIGNRDNFSIKNVALFMTRDNIFLAKYLRYYFDSGLLSKQIELKSRGGAQGFLSLGDIRNLIFFKFDFEELKIIIDYLDKKTTEISNVISKTQQEIELLKEYKTALISEVVTGKVDVRNEILN